MGWSVALASSGIDEWGSRLKDPGRMARSCTPFWLKKPDHSHAYTMHLQHRARRPTSIPSIVYTRSDEQLDCDARRSRPLERAERTEHVVAACALPAHRS